MVRGLVYPQLCRAHVGQQTRPRSGEDQTRIACRSLGSRPLPVWQPIVPRHHRPRWKQESKPHPLLESLHPRTSVHRRDWTSDHCEPRTPSSAASRASPGRSELPTLVESLAPCDRSDQVPPLKRALTLNEIHLKVLTGGTVDACSNPHRFWCSVDGPSRDAAHYLHLLYQQARTARCCDLHRDEGDESNIHQARELLGRMDRV